ncbi:DJ1/PfpI superfamily protein [Acanthamoeba castellanii str. Neff]|uniref:DJ1/PfpI superfamily protein n=1 Tax=Acanthamoeba castellanii (strain ATCC 30010 / Neff) TaxID=1257118 RepID=L8HCC1_ACACF|nr:DJ1/PfpI superfamily protein [Acanthamoeba castellanii str. Neff]ELR23164.1 DJ1/PfpI superfamily protein [Acanthamoeba castellanii str. Neff]
MDQGWEILLQADYPAGARPVAVAHHPVLPLVALAYDDSLIENEERKTKNEEKSEDEEGEETTKHLVWNVEKKVVIAALGADHWTTAVPDKKGVNIHSLTFYDSYTVHHKLLSTLKRAADVDPSQYGLFFASAGHGTLYDYPTAHGLIGIAADVYRRGGVVAAVCHGPAILPAVVDAATGGSIIDGKTVTGFTTLAEGALGVLERIRADGLQTIEEGAERVGARYVAPQKPFEAFSLVDGQVVTGANPASAHLTAENAIAVFDALSSC